MSKNLALGLSVVLGTLAQFPTARLERELQKGYSRYHIYARYSVRHAKWACPEPSHALPALRAYHGTDVLSLYVRPGRYLVDSRISQPGWGGGSILPTLVLMGSLPWNLLMGDLH